MQLNRASHAIVQEIPKGELPAWIMLLPGKGKVETRDGRGPYLNKNPQSILSAFAKFGMPLPGDWEHQSMTAQEKNGPTGASGWIDKMEVRGNGEIWGKVRWTAQAADLISKGEYRYISPVFDYDKRTGEITQLVSFGLTNNPNLYLRAAAKAGEGAYKMGLHEKLMKALSGMEEAKDEDIKKACSAAMEEGAMEEGSHEEPDGDEKPEAPVAPGQPDVKPAEEKAAASVDLSRFVPMATVAAMRQEIAELQAHKAQIEADKVEANLSAAVKAGKIAPADKDTYRVFAKSHPVEFAAAVASMVAKVGTVANTGTAGKPAVTVEAAANSLTADELFIAKQFGHSAEQYAKLKMENEKERAERAATSN